MRSYAIAGSKSVTLIVKVVAIGAIPSTQATAYSDKIVLGKLSSRTAKYPPYIDVSFFLFSKKNI